MGPMANGSDATRQLIAEMRQLFDVFEGRLAGDTDVAVLVSLIVRRMHDAAFKGDCDAFDRDFLVDTVRLKADLFRVSGGELTAESIADRMIADHAASATFPSWSTKLGKARAELVAAIAKPSSANMLSLLKPLGIEVRTDAALRMARKRLRK